MEANYEAEVNPSESGPPAAREVSTGLVTGSGWVGGRERMGWRSTSEWRELERSAAKKEEDNDR